MNCTLDFYQGLERELFDEAYGYAAHYLDPRRRYRTIARALYKPAWYTYKAGKYLWHNKGKILKGYSYYKALQSEYQRQSGRSKLSSSMPPIKRSLSRGRSRTRKRLRNLPPSPVGSSAGRSMSIPPTPRIYNPSLVSSRQSTRSRSATASRSRSLSMSRSRSVYRPARQISRGFGRSSSKSAGMITAPLKVSHRKNSNMIQKKGAYYTIESAKTTSDEYCVYLGHATVPNELATKACIAALLKQLLLKTGIIVNSFTELIPSMTYTFYWTSAGTTAVAVDPVEQSASFTTVGLTPFNTIINRFWNGIGATGFKPWAELTKTDCITSIQVLNGTSSYDLNLANAKVVLHSKSTYKVQNRTVYTSSNNSDELVDNQPIYGKVYEGKGNVVNYLGSDKQSQLTTGRDYAGMITFPTGNSEMREPPSPQMFEGVKKYGKVLLDPGQVKTSVLNDYITMSWKSLQVQLWEGVVNAATTNLFQFKNTIGKYRFFALEKMLDASPVPHGDPAFPKINVAYECQIRLGAMFQFKRNTVTGDYFESLRSDV